MKCALNPHFICIKKVLIYKAFFDALALKLLTKFLEKSTIERCCFCIFFGILMLNQHQILCTFFKVAPKKDHYRKMMQIRCHLNVLALKCTKVQFSTANQTAFKSIYIPQEEIATRKPDYNNQQVCYSYDSYAYEFRIFSLYSG